ncbi:MAG: hypothetical protein HQK53_01195 [Oligoflexia bacterium]|nr:hypothetical protein [Oligoflexia bacterium]
MGKEIYFSVIILLMLLLTGFACKTDSTGSGGRAGVQTVDATVGNKNNPESVSVGYGRVLHDNPRILSGDPTLTDLNLDFSTLLLSTQDYITYSSTLEGSCGPNSTDYASDLPYSYQQCFKVLRKSTSVPLVSYKGRWAFDPNGSDFTQVQSYYHVNKVISKLQDFFAALYRLSIIQHPGSYPTAVSPRLYTQKAYWTDNELMVYSDCDLGDLASWAFYSPANNYLCLPCYPKIAEHPELTDIANHPNFCAAQDPTVIYHELNHAFISVLLNARNRAAALALTLAKVQMGGRGGGEEAEAIGEGLSDFSSYAMNYRTHLGEWGMGLLGVTRPMSEEDPMHIDGISRSDDGRLSYPFYVNYDPNYPKEPAEDPHLGGEILTHFLVALADELVSVCGIDRGAAVKLIYFCLIETMGELGDLTSKASDYQTGFSASNLPDRVNLSAISDTSGAYLSYLWYRAVNPLNYRKFMQSFSKFFIKLADTNVGIGAGLVSCPHGVYGKDQLEKLLDKYGLLLFKTYNDNGNGVLMGHSGTLTAVTSGNALRSISIPKDYLILNPKGSTFYVYDKAKDISAMISSLKSAGMITNISPLIPGDLSYNNNNGKISPGEIVGILPVLFNNSNSIMGGVQVLANDWDHGKLVDWTPVPDVSITGGNNGDPHAIYSGDLRPCNIFDDEFPLESEGAAPLATGTPSVGDCEYITRLNGTHKGCNLTAAQGSANYCYKIENEMNAASAVQEMLMPICLVQYRDDNESKWVSQKRYRENVGFPQEKCLISNSPFDCFIRVIPGADHAYYSKINPMSVWSNSVVATESDLTVSPGNMFLMEINPRVPPGTTFDCRIRARFTNCDDCWHDPIRSDHDDYLDYEYAGGKPFKILHIQFTVTD